MLPIAALTRRAVAATAFFAAAPIAASGKKRKNKKKKSPPPLAFAVVTPTDIAGLSPAEGTFNLSFEWALVYPAGPHANTANGDSMPLTAATEAQTRAAIAAEIRSRAFQKLDLAGFDVPEDRIAVVLL